MASEQHTSSTTPASPVNAFEWNVGWFGAQLGGTLWLLVGAGLFASQSIWLSSIWLSGFIALNGFGCWLWSQRHRRSAYQSIQWFLGVTCIVALGAWTALVLISPSLSQHFKTSPTTGFISIFGTIFGLMILFYLKQTWMTRSQDNSAPPTA